jgi:hypothetical protein
VVNLSFGLHRAIPEDVDTAWGARWIFPDDRVRDRQDLRGPAATELKNWLNGGAVLRAKANAREFAAQGIISSRSSETVTLFSDDRGVVVGNPNGSYGYLYVAAWLKSPPEQGVAA